MDYDDGKDAIAKFNEMLGSVIELIVCAQGIADVMHVKVKGSNLYQDIFVFSFLERMIDIAASIVTVSKANRLEIVDGVVFGSKQDRFADAAILARSALEGMWRFQAYKRNSTSIAKKWYLYTIYENYRRRLRIEKIEHNDNMVAAQVAAYKWLNTTYATQHIKAAVAEFEFENAKETWYDQQGIPELASAFCDEHISLVKRYNIADSKQRSQLSKECRKLYAIAYGDFSRIVHWSPLGIGGTGSMGSFMSKDGVDIRFLPALIFDSVFLVSKHANDEYSLGFDVRLNDILNRFSQKNEK